MFSQQNIVIFMRTYSSKKYEYMFENIKSTEFLEWVIKFCSEYYFSVK
jgi:hypothetical protein